ncbi:MAG: EAL domain-containing protein [Burkholderiales bacterium]|nr:EAL domain-containing protein [Burkholderiales bacterium]
MPNTHLDRLTPAQLQALLDSLPVPVFVKQPDGTLMLVNKAWEATIGIGLADMQGGAMESVFPREQVSRFWQRDQEARDTRQTISYDEIYWSPLHGTNRLGRATKRFLFDGQGNALFLVGTLQDVTEQIQLQKLVDCERTLLEQLARNAPLQTIMDAFTRGYEGVFDGVQCSILLLDDAGLHLRHGAAPSLPQAYSQAIDGVAIGPNTGSCGTAAYTGKETLVSDIATDPLWVDYKHLALAHGLRACWSIPIISTKGKVLGTFANYTSTPRPPSSGELEAIKRSAYLMGMAIEHKQTAQQALADQAAVRESAEHLQTLVNNMVDGVITISERGIIESFNKSASAMFGYAEAEVLGQNISILMPEPHRSEHDSYLQFYKDNGEARVVGINREVFGQRSNGQKFPVSLSVSRILRKGQPTFVGLVRDITQQRHDEEEIRRLAFYDPLTALPNRRLLMDRLKQALVTSERTGQHGALMFLDLDHFKQLNDSLGHDVGDELLKQVAQRMRGCIREGDSVARLGGDEFVVLLEALSMQPAEAASQAEGIASKIMASLGQPYVLHGHRYSSTPSLGIVIFLEHAEETRDELLKRADAAMYQAKAAGRNTVRFFDPVMQAAAAIRSETERDIRSGLARGEFVLHYQMQVGNGGAIEGHEALVRWNHPHRGLVAPGQFIPLAEETGLILPLGQWVMTAACQQLVQWARHPATAHWTVSVNVSALQFAQPDFVDRLFATLDETGANPRRLKLELTESMLAHDVDDIIGKMNAVKARGTGFSLDDFGTGYSSLSYLKQLPLDQLKIDQSFVRDLQTDSHAAAIARTVVALGHSLGLRVIAEGVETSDQRDALHSFGCDAYQGYFFGKPVPLEPASPG